jgi:hypothetical protein
MLKELFSSLKKEKPEEIPEIANEKIIILPNILEEIKDILEDAYLFEHKQLKEKDIEIRREICADALIKYQQALDKVNKELRRATKTKMLDTADVYNAQSLYIKKRMDYLLSVRKHLKEKIHIEAA